MYDLRIKFPKLTLTTTGTVVSVNDAPIYSHQIYSSTYEMWERTMVIHQIQQENSISRAAFLLAPPGSGLPDIARDSCCQYIGEGFAGLWRANRQHARFARLVDY